MGGSQWLDGYCSWNGQDDSLQMALVCQGWAALKKIIQPKEGRSSPLPFLIVQHKGCGFMFSCETWRSCLFCHLPVGRCQAALHEHGAKVTWKFLLVQDVSPWLFPNRCLHYLLSENGTNSCCYLRYSLTSFFFLTLVLSCWYPLFLTTFLHIL